MQTIKVIEMCDPVKFEFEVNSLLSEGYEISSTNCGFVNDAKYDYCASYQAVLVCNAEEEKLNSTAAPVQQLQAKIASKMKHLYEYYQPSEQFSRDEVITMLRQLSAVQ